jgi:hypothetical protein
MLERPRTEHNVIQKRLAFDRDWSGTVLTRARKAPKDPAPLASWPTRGFGGAARRRCQPNGDLNVNGCEEIITCLETFCNFCKALTVGS